MCRCGIESTYSELEAEQDHVRTFTHRTTWSLGRVVTLHATVKWVVDECTVRRIQVLRHRIVSSISACKQVTGRRQPASAR